MNSCVENFCSLEGRKSDDRRFFPVFKDSVYNENCNEKNDCRRRNYSSCPAVKTLFFLYTVCQFFHIQFGGFFKKVVGHNFFARFCAEKFLFQRFHRKIRLRGFSAQCAVYGGCKSAVNSVYAQFKRTEIAVGNGNAFVRFRTSRVGKIFCEGKINVYRPRKIHCPVSGKSRLAPGVNDKIVLLFSEIGAGTPERFLRNEQKPLCFFIIQNGARTCTRKLNVLLLRTVVCAANCKQNLLYFVV